MYYKDDFYESRGGGSKRSAEIIVPLILDLISPKSVIDVGCGVGAWLSVFNENGVEDIIGLDGNWVDPKLLLIPKESFTSCDLEKRVRIDRKFDLVISLEVGEHISKSSAETYVDSLVSLGTLILFSAAIPFQIGRHHVNEQWPDYWANLFDARGYCVLDPIRRKIWQDDEVDYWYAQNILMFVRKDCLERYPKLKAELDCISGHPLSIVHPKMYYLSSAPIRIMLAIPVINSIFLKIVTGNLARSWIRKLFLKR